MLRTVAALFVLAFPAVAEGIEPLEGWQIYPTTKSYDQLVVDVVEAVKANGLIVVTQAGPTKAAASRGITIPGNRVIGVFNNDFAVRVLETSTAAMIEAPIRFYVTENRDGTATLSYKTPSHVFSPYVPEGGIELTKIAEELDSRFQQVAESATE